MALYKYITEVDDVWHDSKEEMPCISLDVEFMDKDGNIHQDGHIQIDMAGFYAYLRDQRTYSSFDDMVKWRFRPNKDYTYYIKAVNYGRNN